MVDVLRRDPSVGAFHVVLEQRENSNDCRIVFEFTYDHAATDNRDAGQRPDLGSSTIR